MPRLLFSLLSLLVLVGSALAGTASARAPLPPVKHVFVIVLENQDQARTFAPGSPAPYLARTLRARGEYLPSYFGVTHFSLGNYVAMVSGQGSNTQTQSDCQVFTNLLPGAPGPDGQALGQGCVYPAATKTIADQLQARRLGWRGYMEDMGNIRSREAARCGHPAIGAQDKTQSAKVGDQYATRHNPFVYFHSLLDNGTCAKYDVPLSHLRGDLAASRVGAFNFITPNLCHDGHDAPCVNGEPGGLKSADAFLRTWIPRITSSRAYRDGGLIMVTFDEAEDGAQACCGEPQFPNTANNGGTTQGRGGGKVGAVLLSRFVRPRTVNPTPYNHFALLRSTEDLFGLSHLGYAARPELRAFGSDVYNGCFDRPLPRGARRYPRGAVIAAARVSRGVLSVRLAHSARLEVRSTGSARQLRARRGACSLARFTVNRRATTPIGFAGRGPRGEVRIRAYTGRGLERRVIGF